MPPKSLAVVTGFLAALVPLSAAWPQTYPDRPVRIVIAFPAGGTIDTDVCTSR
jgi:tripartite-type tricarboxylate transporter receptor subunit TctC